MMIVCTTMEAKDSHVPFVWVHNIKSRTGSWVCSDLAHAHAAACVTRWATHRASFAMRILKNVNGTLVTIHSNTVVGDARELGCEGDECPITLCPVSGLCARTTLTEGTGRLKVPASASFTYNHDALKRWAQSRSIVEPAAWGSDGYGRYGYERHYRKTTDFENRI